EAERLRGPQIDDQAPGAACSRPALRRRTNTSSICRMCLPASALLEPAEAEGGIDGRERRAEKQPALNQRQEWRPKDERDRRLHEPLRERIAAALAQQHALSTKLEPVERANVSLAEPPHFLEDLVRDRAVAEVRIQHLGGDAAVAMATLTPIAPAGLIVCAA